eukprot:29935-Pelagococcus_subviridis.AAC.4
MCRAGRDVARRERRARRLLFSLICQQFPRKERAPAGCMGIVSQHRKKYAYSPNSRFDWPTKDRGKG